MAAVFRSGGCFIGLDNFKADGKDACGDHASDGEEEGKLEEYIH